MTLWTWTTGSVWLTGPGTLSHSARSTGSGTVARKTRATGSRNKDYRAGNRVPEHRELRPAKYLFNFVVLLFGFI